MSDISERALKVMDALKKRYPNPPVNLHADTPWQQVVATVLSAQCTDARVNMVTPELFRRWPTPEAQCKATIEELEAVIHSVGFYHAKAKNILASAQIVCDNFGGVIPRTIAELTTLPGVARKTANVVLWTQYGINEGIAVDTHVKRISNLLGLTKESEPVRVERDLMKLLPQEDWGLFNHLMVLFGREVCVARRPNCSICEMATFCPSAQKA